MNKIDELADWRIRYGFSSPKKKIKIYFTAKAFAKTIMLVKAFSVEIGWNMVIEPHKDGYKVYDILVYPQEITSDHIYVNDGKESTKTSAITNWGIWKANLDDKIEAAINGHGHSHVNMAPFKSFVDENQQHDEILTKRKGFYFFQIWNKKNEVNSFFYDIDNKVYYSNNDIEIIVEGTENFIEEAYNMVTDIEEGD